LEHDCTDPAPGRDAAFSAFVDASWSRLHRYGYVLTGSSAEAEELVQETLVKVYQAWHRIAPDGAALAYTRTAMARTHVSRWRSLTRRSAVEDRVVLDRTLAAGHPAWESLAADRDEVWRALATLPPRQRAVVVLRFYEDLPERAIAEALGCTVGTVKSQLSRALATLRGSAAVLSIVGSGPSGAATYASSSKEEVR
jgi:RNA polymerase sigma-70 factor (sigma-E family)